MVLLASKISTWATLSTLMGKDDMRGASCLCDKPSSDLKSLQLTQNQYQIHIENVFPRSKRNSKCYFCVIVCIWSYWLAAELQALDRIEQTSVELIVVSLQS